MSSFLQRWFSRTRVSLAPRATSGREVAFAAGYSRLELERAHIPEAEALSLGIQIDRNRNSALGSNVMELERLRRTLG